jgi:hypothetical protein
MQHYMSLQYCVEKYTPPCLGEFEGVHLEGLFGRLLQQIKARSHYWRMRFLLVYSTTHAFKWLFPCPCYVYSNVLVMWKPICFDVSCNNISHMKTFCFYISQIGWPNTKVMLALLMPLTHLKAKWICIKLLRDSLTYILMHLHIITIGFILAWFCPSGDWKQNIFENCWHAQFRGIESSGRMKTTFKKKKEWSKRNDVKFPFN